VLRHEFQPGRLVAGAFLALAGALYAADAGGLWETPWFAAIPVVTGGLCLAGAVGVLSRGIRRRRAVAAGKDPAEPGLDAPD
jgi:peptidoglycan/LPS O-acetylase OafA/YrhL